MSQRTAWGAITGVLMVGWALIAALVFAFLSWSETTKTVVAAVVAGAGAVAILWLRMRRLPRNDK